MDADQAATPAAKLTGRGFFIPTGKTHDVINFGVLFLITITLFDRLGKEEATIFASGYLIGLLFFSPDLDIKSSSYRRWGPLRYIWLPFIFFFKHRGISHNPFIGPVVRLLYIGFLTLGIFVILKVELPTINYFWSIVFLMGFWVPSLIHWYVDRRL